MEKVSIIYFRNRIKMFDKSNFLECWIILNFQTIIKFKSSQNLLINTNLNHKYLEGVLHSGSQEKVREMSKNLYLSQIKISLDINLLLNMSIIIFLSQKSRNKLSKKSWKSLGILFLSFVIVTLIWTYKTTTFYANKIRLGVLLDDNKYLNG